MPLQQQTMEVLHPAVHFSVRDDLTVKQFRKQENVNGTHQKFFPLVHSILASILVKVLIRRTKSNKEEGG